MIYGAPINARCTKIETLFFSLLFSFFRWENRKHKAQLTVQKVIGTVYEAHLFFLYSRSEKSLNPKHERTGHNY